MPSWLDGTDAVRSVGAGKDTPTLVIYCPFVSQAPRGRTARLGKARLFCLATVCRGMYRRACRTTLRRACARCAVSSLCAAHTSRTCWQASVGGSARRRSPCNPQLLSKNCETVTAPCHQLHKRSSIPGLVNAQLALREAGLKQDVGDVLRVATCSTHHALRIATCMMPLLQRLQVVEKYVDSGQGGRRTYQTGTAGRRDSLRKQQ
jgi:hypothetical protein